MATASVPVTLGSPRFTRSSIDGCGIVHAWFPSGAVLEPHVHDPATVAVMLAGSFDLRFARHEHACTPATVSVEPAGERHANRIGRAGAEVLVLQPDLSRTELWRPFREVLDGVSSRQDGAIAARAARLAAEIESPDPFTSLMAEALTFELLVLTARGAVRDAGDAPGRRPPPWLLRVEEMLHHAPVRLRLADCASEVGMHPGHVARAFRRHFGVSIGSYARRLRLDAAAERLRRSGEPIAAIAHETGFADQSHLTRAFKRYLGVTPDVHRQRYRAAPAAPGPQRISPT